MYVWIIKNWNGIIFKMRDKGLWLDYSISGVELFFYFIVLFDLFCFNRELLYYVLFIVYNIDYRIIVLECVWWF